MRFAIGAGLSYMDKPTTTCDACGMRYTFTSHKDRCLVCCPKQDDKTDDYELDDWGSGDDLTAESESS